MLGEAVEGCRAVYYEGANTGEDTLHELSGAYSVLSTSVTDVVVGE